MLALHQPSRSAHAATIGGLLLLFLVCAMAIFAALNCNRATASLQRSQTIHHLINKTYGDLYAAIAGQRGYLLTSDPSYVQIYRTSATDLTTTLGVLRNAVGDDAQKRVQVDHASELAHRKLAELEETSRLHATEPQDGARPAALLYHERALTDQLAQTIRQMAETETRNELNSLHAAHRMQQLLLSAIFVATLVALLMACIVIWQTTQYRTELERQNIALSEQMHQQQSVESQLRQSQKMESLGQLTGGIAHDFNNMLSVVMGNLEVLLYRLKRGESAHIEPLIHNALKGTSKAAELTRRLLAFSRRQTLQPVSVDVNACVEDMLSILTRTLGENVAIETSFAASLWCAYVDRSQLENAILNLTVNSRDAMHGNGKLKIETSNIYLDERYASRHPDVTPGDYVMLSITDSGCGMPPEVLQKVFEPFFTTKGVGKGTGLGLSQVHGFISQSKGHVTLSSAVDSGTTVRLYLPRTSEMPLTTTTAKYGGETAPQKILVVEDEPDVRAFVSTALEELGYFTVEAANAVEAEQMLRSQRDIALMVTDVMMPGPSGIQLVEVIEGEFPDLRVVFMTGYSHETAAHGQQESAGRRWLQKPFTVQELSQALHAVLNDDSVPPAHAKAASL